jgi:hypothetical protein
MLRYETMVSGIKMGEADNRNMYLIQVSEPEPKENERRGVKKWDDG